MDEAPDLLGEVSGLGAVRTPDAQAITEAAQIEDERDVPPDLRGERDRDPKAAHPWRGT